MRFSRLLRRSWACRTRAGLAGMGSGRALMLPPASFLLLRACLVLGLVVALCAGRRPADAVSACPGPESGQAGHAHLAPAGLARCPVARRAVSRPAGPPACRPRAG